MITIKEKNQAFSKMSKMHKRIAIAKDVIAQVKAKKFKASPGTYCKLKLNKRHKFKTEGEVELQLLMEDGAINKCNVCAIGSIFASKVSIGNKFKIEVRDVGGWGDSELTIDTDLDDDDMMPSLRGIYTEKELRLIEYVFEGSDIGGFHDSELYEFHKTVQSYKKVYRKAEDRLIAIMENIINNEGIFKLENLTLKSK
jgi:hypothetical protein